MIEAEVIPPPLDRMKRRHKYQPVGRCIYCGCEGSSDLTLEHIIPESLGGMLELPTASCNSCQTLIGRFEGQNARRLFLPIRRQFNFPSKGRGKARRDQRQQETFVVRINGRKRDIPAADYPGLLVSFVFPPPMILFNIPPEYREFSGRVSVGMLPQFEERLSALRAKYGNNVTFPVSVGAETVGRLLAKIGHAYAVAELGLDSFRPYLLGIIRDQDPLLLHHVVGSADGEAPTSDDLHEITIARPEDLGPENLVVVKIHLFSNHKGMAVHYVVAGERT
jgi:hypothetical protein